MTVETKIDKLKNFFKIQTKSNRYLRYYLENCVRCGNCIENCHFYQGESSNELNAPVFKNEQVRRLLKQNSLLGKLGLYGKPKDDYINSLAYAVFESCTNCRRCVMYCPFSLDISVINTIARTGLIGVDEAPEDLLMLADMQIERRNNIDKYLDMFKDLVSDVEKEVQEEINDPTFKIPIAEKSVKAKILYVPLSRAITMSSAGKIFHAAGVDWVMSKFDIVNFGFLVGDADRAKKILKPIFDEAIEIGAETLVIGECGHPYKLALKIAEGWWGKQPFEIELIVETVANLLEDKKIKLDKSKNPGKFTFHDPCQHGRNAGIIEEPRVLLRAAVEDFVEMEPHGAKNWCCGGGGGVIAVPDYDDTRRKGGKVKADQIKETQATVLTTTCENCKTQIEDLNEYYDLGVEVEGVIDAVARALIYK
ncbi:MAG: (Fe-S)-binding protein [Candidatus Heimdallarchaeaceae archaeon]